MKRDTGPNALRRGRFSQQGAEYFLTLCEADRNPVLAGKTADFALQALLAAETDGIWQVRCATIMPDHLHLLLRLGGALTLSQSVARFKIQTKQGFLSDGGVWQENYYDHCLRSNESAEPVFRYIYLNPYRAGLARQGETWPWFYCAPEDWIWFSQLTDTGLPFPEWLK